MDDQKTVLLVEDDPVMRDLISLVITQQYQKSIEILTADNGEAALDMIQTGKPELVILDILLPKMNGLQLLQQLKNKQLLEQTKIIMISALGFQEVVQQVMDTGVKDFLVKPFKVEELIERAGHFLKLPALATHLQIAS
jgi:DNA-binding response OmpR family regulator